jgi:hypothetical protein
MSSSHKGQSVRGFEARKRGVGGIPVSGLFELQRIFISISPDIPNKLFGGRRPDIDSQISTEVCRIVCSGVLQVAWQSLVRR